MAIYRGNIGDLLEPGFREIYDDAFAEMPLVFPQILNMNSSSKQDEKDSGLTGFGYLQETSEGAGVDYEDPNLMYDVTYTHKKYTKGFKVSEEAVEDDQYNKIKRKPAQLARATRRTTEYHAAEVFNKAFDTGYLGGDAKPLCSTTHPSSSGLSSQSNANTSGITLTEVNLETARIAFRQQLDDKQMRVQAMPNKLIVPVDLDKDARIITGSTMRPGTADNDINVYKGTLQVVSWEYLTLNNTLWFLLDSNLHKLNWFWRVKPEFKQDNAFDTGMALFKVRTRFSKGFSDWRGTWGSKGDASSYTS